METGVPTISLSQSQSDFIVNNNAPGGATRTFEPDTDDCAQPEQRPRVDEHDEQMFQRPSLDDGARDTSTIFSQRSGTETLDTADKTVQRGSRSRRPSPDDQPTAQPAQVCHETIPRAIQPGPGNPSASMSSSHSGRDMPSSLSFPSPPSVDDEELPTQKINVHINQDVQDTVMSGFSNNEAKDRVHLHEGGFSSKRKKWLYMILLALIVVVVAVVVALTTTGGKSEPANQEMNKGSQNKESSPARMPSMAPTNPPLEPTLAPPSANLDEDNLSEDVQNETTLDDPSPASPTELTESPSLPPAQTPGLRRAHP